MELSAELNGLLKSVSRSFYLSLHVLPRPVRGYLSLGYLLARASDTMADSATVSVAQRLELLDQFTAAVDGEFSPALRKGVGELRVPHPGEQLLMTQLESCFALLSQMESRGVELMRCVLGHIVHGQKLDLQRFPGMLPDAAALEEYTFLVAGSVGEFWTDILAWKIPSAFTMPVSEMRALGRTYGQGLQLVNILRDLEEDIANGRQYLPGTEDILTRRSHWTSVAEDWLQSGKKYVINLRGWRVRFTADLPWRLGLETLRALPEGNISKAKVPRQTVRRVMWGAGWRSFLKVKVASD